MDYPAALSQLRCRGVRLHRNRKFQIRAPPASAAPTSNRRPPYNPRVGGREVG